MKTIWCQWNDLNLPSDFTLLSGNIHEISQDELDSIDIYVPQYMGGLTALEPVSLMKNASVLQLLMAGYDDALRFKRPGLRLFNARGVHDFSTAELTISLILASLRGIDGFIRAQDQQKWSHERLDSIYGSKVAIVGAGSVANKIAEFLRTFGIEPHLYGRSARESIKAFAQLDEQLHAYDIVILIVPLTDETNGMFNAPRIAKMKPGSLLVNVARGPVVETDALVAALNAGQNKAAIDVTDPEPLPSSHPLWRSPNLIISPHVGGNSAAFEPHGRRLIEEQCHRISKSEPLINEIAW